MHRYVILAALAFVPQSLSAQAKGWKEEAIKYVRSLQTSTGGFLSMAPRPEIRLAPTLGATSSALRALHYLGGEAPNKGDALKFVEACYADGGFSNFQRGKPDVFTTAVGVMAVKELQPSLAKYKEPVTKYLSENAKDFNDIRIAAAGLERLAVLSPKAKEWLAQMEKDRNADGTWGKDTGLARDTASYAVTYLRLGGKLDNRDLVLKTIRAGQRKDGGFGKAETDASDLETSYRVMRCFMMLKEQPADAAALRGFLAKCRNADGGFGVTPAEGSTVSATYFAAIVDHWLK